MSRIEDMQTADRWFKALAARKDELAQTKTYRDAEVKKIEDWYAGIEENVSKEIESIENELKSYYAAMLEENPKAKLNTPYGKVMKRTEKTWALGAELVKVRKERELGEYIRTKVTEEADKVAIKRVFAVREDGAVVDPNGEVLENVTVSAETSYKVEVAG